MSRRKEALAKWRSMNKSERMDLWLGFQWECWKSGHFARTWNYAMFSTSSGMIEKAVCDLVLDK